MTRNTITIELSCNGRTLRMGPHEEIDITAVSGLESSGVQLSTSDNALVDGVSLDGKKIKPRVIHIEASFRSGGGNPENRARVIQFFNPKYTGKATITCMGISRNIEYELEGWTFGVMRNMDGRLKIIADLLCPDPYMRNVDNFGKNMANISPLFAFPWRMLAARAADTAAYPAEARGMLLGGMPMGYRTLHKEVVLSNDGDVPTGVRIQFVATRGAVTNPKITNTGTGQFMRVCVAMEQGDTLMVDTNERHQTITLNGANCYQRIDRKSEPFQLAVGDNYLEYDADENYTNLDVNLFYTPKYLGV